MSKSLSERLVKTQFLYWLLKTSAKILFYNYYKKITIFGEENIPYGDPFIFAPNHQNALMDALAVLFTQKSNTVFLARADIFKGQRTINFLNFIKILPVFRQRDGIENLGKNEEIFDTTIEVLKNNRSVGIMPEGNHGDKHRLRNMVKGLFRIAFSAQEQLPDKTKSVKIVPVSLYYGHYINCYASLVLNYGKPIDVKDYMEEYNENKPVAINKLKDKLRESLSELMIDIQHEEYYETIYFISKLCNTPEHYNKNKDHKRKALRKYAGQQQIVRKMEKAVSGNVIFMPQLNYFTSSYLKGLTRLDLRDWIFRKNRYSLFNILFNLVLLVIGLPVFIYGALFNAIPFTIPVKFSKKFKDPQFHSSVKFVIAFILFVVLYLIYFVVVSIVFKTVLAGLLFIVSLPFAGHLALKISFLYKKTIAKIRYNILTWKKNKDLLLMKDFRKKIILLVSDIINS